MVASWCNINFIWKLPGGVEDLPPRLDLFWYLNHGSDTAQRTKRLSLRRLKDVWKRSRQLTTKPDLITTSGRKRPIYGVLKTSDLRRLEDARFTTSWKRLISDVLKTSDLWRHEDAGFMSCWRCPIYVALKTFDL